MQYRVGLDSVMLFSWCLRGQIKWFVMFAPMMSHLIVSAGSWTAAAVPWDGMLTICVFLVVDRDVLPQNLLTETFVMLYHSPTVMLCSHQTVRLMQPVVSSTVYSVFGRFCPSHTTPVPLRTSWVIFALMLTCVTENKQMHVAQWLNAWLGYLTNKKTLKFQQKSLEYTPPF